MAEKNSNYNLVLSIQADIRSAEQNFNKLKNQLESGLGKTKIRNPISNWAFGKDIAAFKGAFINAVGAVGAKFSSFGTSIRTIGSSFASVFSDAMTGATRLVSTLLSGFNKALGVLKSFGKYFLMTGASLAGIGYAINKTMAPAAKIETSERQIKALGGDDKLVQFAKDTLAIGDVNQNLQKVAKMLELKLDPVKYLKPINDYQAVTGRDSRTLITTLGQIANERGERAVTQLAQVGISKSDLEKRGARFDDMGNSDNIEALNNAVLAVLKERYSGGMEGYNKTYEGATDNLGDSFFKMFSDGFKGVLPYMTEAVNMLSGLFDKIKTSLSGLDWDKIGTSFLEKLTQAKNLIDRLFSSEGRQELVNGISKVFTSLPGVLMAVISDVWNVLPRLLGAFVNDLISGLQEFAGTVIDWWEGGGMGALINAMATGAEKIWDKMTGKDNSTLGKAKKSYQVQEDLKSKIAGIGEDIKKGYKEVRLYDSTKGSFRVNKIPLDTKKLEDELKGLQSSLKSEYENYKRLLDQLNKEKQAGNNPFEFKPVKNTTKEMDAIRAEGGIFKQAGPAISDMFRGITQMANTPFKSLSQYKSEAGETESKLSKAGRINGVETFSKSQLDGNVRILNDYYKNIAQIPDEYKQEFLKSDEHRSVEKISEVTQSVAKSQNLPLNINKAPEVQKPETVQINAPAQVKERYENKLVEIFNKIQTPKFNGEYALSDKQKFGNLEALADYKKLMADIPESIKSGITSSQSFAKIEEKVSIAQKIADTIATSGGRDMQQGSKIVNQSTSGADAPANAKIVQAAILNLMSGGNGPSAAARSDAKSTGIKKDAVSIAELERSMLTLKVAKISDLMSDLIKAIADNSIANMQFD